MRKLFLAFSLFITLAASAQNDKIYMHNGKVVEGSIVKVAEFTVVFKYANEDAEQTVSKYAVNKIIYGKSGREEKVTDKIVVASKDDWESVIILEDKSEVAGLTKVDDIKGKTSGWISYRTGAGKDRKSEERLRQGAAELGCPFVLITADKDPSLVNPSSIKKGIAYKY
jgi:sRNA-binding regulator protein Hfq